MDAETLANLTQFPHFAALVTLFERVRFLIPLSTPRYHTFVINIIGCAAQLNLKSASKQTANLHEAREAEFANLWQIWSEEVDVAERAAASQCSAIEAQMQLHTLWCCDLEEDRKQAALQVKFPVFCSSLFCLSFLRASFLFLSVSSFFSSVSVRLFSLNFRLPLCLPHLSTCLVLVVMI